MTFLANTIVSLTGAKPRTAGSSCRSTRWSNVNEFAGHVFLLISPIYIWTYERYYLHIRLHHQDSTWAGSTCCIWIQKACIFDSTLASKCKLDFGEWESCMPWFHNLLDKNRIHWTLLQKYMFEWNLCFSQQGTHYGYGQLVLSTSKPLLSTPLYAQGHEYPERTQRCTYWMPPSIHSFLWIFETRLRINKCFWPWNAGMIVKPAMDRQLQLRHHNFILHKITHSSTFPDTTSLLTNTVAHSLPSQYTSPNAVSRLKEPSKVLFHIKTHPKMLAPLTRLCTHRKTKSTKQNGSQFPNIDTHQKQDPTDAMRSTDRP